MTTKWTYKTEDCYWDDAERILRALGKLGWELVSVIHPLPCPPAVVQLYLKRPLG